MMAAVVAAMTLGELLGPAAGPDASVSVTDLVADSRQVTPGAAFVALAGARNHGLDFADDALALGAEVVLYDPAEIATGAPARSLSVPGLASRLGELGQRFFARERFPAHLIGVTGTNGKTSIAWLVAQALTSLGEPSGYVGTIGYGLPGNLRPHALTTPDCLTLHRELAEIATHSAAIEVSSHALAQNRVAGLEFDVACFSNLSRDHLDLHKSMERYFATKAMLFERPGLKSAVVNIRDAHGEALLDRLAPLIRRITIALDAGIQADVSAQFESRGLAGMLLRIDGSFGQTEIESGLIGNFNAENLLLALGALVARDHALDAAARALSRAHAPPGRMEVFGGERHPWVIVDYAHTPEALTRVLATVSDMNSGELTCLFGCGGDRDRGKRALMGQAAAAHAEHIVLTDDNPRSEDPAAIIADIQVGTTGHDDVRVEPDRERAIAAAIDAAAPGDIVLIAGKGHETRQLVGAETRAFDDRAVVNRILEGRS